MNENILDDTGIYMITGPTGKCYIGSAVSFKRRWQLHINTLRKNTHHNTHLQNAFNKYGEAAFIFTKIAFCSVQDLISTEQKFIDQLQPEYNICKTAGSTLGLTHGPLSEEIRSKISLAHIGMKASEETKAKISKIHKGKIISEEHRKLLSELNTGSNNAFYGKKHKPETLEKVSGGNHHRAKEVICLETGTKFSSISLARKWLRESGILTASSSAIVECCRLSTRYTKAYGYTWRYC